MMGISRRKNQQTGTTNAISALDAEGLETLKSHIRKSLNNEAITLDLNVPQCEGKLLSQFYKRSEILQQDVEGNDIHLRIRLSPDYADRLQLNRFELA